jgi:uncharacterized repeat protein (TIGR04138 family)
MNGIVFDDAVLENLRRMQPQFSEEAYLFVLSALHHVIRGLAEPRHVTGTELAEGVKELALDRFGPMARTVLHHWGVRSTRNVGEVVFALVECGVLIKQAGDMPEDFEEVFDFDQVFDERYPWGGR